MSRPSTVMHVIRPQPDGRVGGADLHVLDLVAHQRTHGHRVVVLALGNRAFAGRALERGAVPADVVPGWRPDFLVRLRAFVREADVAVIHGHGYSADLVAVAARPNRSARRDTGPAVVVTVHGFVRATPLLRLRTRLDEHCLPRVDAVITTSTAEAHRLRARLPATRVVAIPNGVHTPHLGSRRAGVVRTIAFVGRLAPEKRPDRFLRVAAALAATDPDLRFQLIGSGPLEPALRALARRLGLLARCEFAGLVADVERRLADEIDVLVSLSDSEGTPRAVLEAMAAGRPVVATAVGGVPDLVSSGRDGLLVPATPDDAVVAAATDAVRTLLADPDAAARLGRGARRTVARRFTVAAMGDRVAEVYAEVTTPDARRG